MKLSPSEQDAIVGLLTRIYMDLAAIETEYELMSGEGDFRPRVEHFHDAVRAFTTQDPAHQKAGGRLSIEFLAYDLACLRFLQEKPLSSFKPKGDRLSPSTEVIVINSAPTPQARRPDRAMRERISELYRHYAVLFAALLKPIADRDYHERVDNLNQDVEDLHTIMQQFNDLGTGKDAIAQAATAVQHLEDEGLRPLLIAWLQQQKYKKKEEIGKIVQKLKQESARKDKERANVEKAHMDYALAQLGIYEESKDLLKKMAGQGMNLAGKFVEASVAETRREMGR